MTPNRPTVDVLVAALGRAVHAVYLADREAGDTSYITEAQQQLREATRAVTELACASDVDLGRAASAWEAIARAQDLAFQACAVCAESRSQSEATREMWREAREQGDRARRHAQRIRQAWERLQARQGPRPE